jgi:hypothetical protein
MPMQEWDAMQCFFFLNVKYSRGGPHCKVLFKIREARQLIEYQQRKKKLYKSRRKEGGSEVDQRRQPHNQERERANNTRQGLLKGLRKSIF